MISQNLVSTWSKTCTCVICLPVFTNNTFSDLLNYVCWNIPRLRSCSKIHNRQDIWSMISAKMFYVLCRQLNYSAYKFCIGFEGINITRVLLAQQESFFHLLWWLNIRSTQPCFNKGSIFLWWLLQSSLSTVWTCSSMHSSSTTI